MLEQEIKKVSIDLSKMYQDVQSLQKGIQSLLDSINKMNHSQLEVLSKYINEKHMKESVKAFADD